MREALRVFLGFILDIFFRRIEVVGAERVPATDPVLFAVNHPNALVDPMLLLCRSPRPVSFLAKAPLFRMPVIGWFVRALGSVPVYRRQDPETDVSRNRETFARARALLEAGGAIAIAPEGASHSDPKMRPLKTGAARMALGAGTARPVQIVPVGLFYTAKERFRSDAALAFGRPIAVSAARLDDQGEPPRDLVADVTKQIELGLAELVLQSDEREALELVGRVERILATQGPTGDQPSVVASLALRRRLLDGYTELRARDPALIGRVRARAERLDAALSSADLEPSLMTDQHPVRKVIARTPVRLLDQLVLLPLAIPGLVLHFPAYWIIDWLARRIAGRNLDAVSSIKIIAGCVFFPLTWILSGWLVARSFGWPLGLTIAMAGPAMGYAAVRFLERAGELAALARVLRWSLFRRRTFATLVRERDRLREEIGQLADLVRAPVPAPDSQVTSG